MELDNIEKLIEKYYNATSSMAEEETLKRYFSEKNVAAHLEQYTPLFQYFTEAKEEKYTRQLELPKATGARKNYVRWASIAAVAVLLFGVYFNTSSSSDIPLTEEFTAEEIASAQEALVLLSSNFNKGSKQLYHLEAFKKQTNKFLIKE